MFISCSKIHNLRAYLAQDRRWRRGLDVRNNAAVLFIQHKTAGGDVDWMNGRSSAILMSVRVPRLLDDHFASVVYCRSLRRALRPARSFRSGHQRNLTIFFRILS